MVQLTPDQQALLVETTPNVFVPVAGGWGRRGSTNVRLSAADPATLKNALRIAWENVALKTSAKRKAASVREIGSAEKKFKVTRVAPSRAPSKPQRRPQLPGIEERHVLRHACAHRARQIPDAREGSRARSCSVAQWKKRRS